MEAAQLAHVDPQEDDLLFQTFVVFARRETPTEFSRLLRGLSKVHTAPDVNEAMRPRF